ncbi:hypothetical protein [Arthrobacter psychrolactophilus]
MVATASPASGTSAQDELTFQQLSGTMMACDDIDTWLSKAAGASIKGDVMTVTDAKGAVLGTLDRRN